MHVIADDLIFHLQQRGGISRIYREIWPRMLDLDPSLTLEIATSPGAVDLPPHPRLTVTPALPPILDSSLKPYKLTWPLRAEITGLRRRRPPSAQGDGATPSAARAGTIWHSTYYSAPRFWPGPKVIMAHDLVHERFPELFDARWGAMVRAQKRRAARAADLVICISRSTQRDVIGFWGVPVERTAVVHLAASPTFSSESSSYADGDARPRPSIDPAVFAKAGAVQLPQPFALFLGARPAYKNFDRVLEALAREQRVAELHLVAVGPEWSDRERGLVSQLRLASRVIQLPWADDDTLVDLYRKAAAFIYPALYEGFGIPLVEAMACGCPIVASDIPSSREVAGDVALYFPPREVGALGNALATALAERRPSDRTRAGMARAAEFSWERTAAGVLDAYRGLVP